MFCCRRRERADKEAKRLEREAEEEAARQVSRKGKWIEKSKTCRQNEVVRKLENRSIIRWMDGWMDG
jgi:hypothetical protein